MSINECTRSPLCEMRQRAENAEAQCAEYARTGAALLERLRDAEHQRDALDAHATKMVRLNDEMEQERDAARAEGDEAAHQLRLMKEERDALARGIAAMAADGLDIDDPGTAPVWTGKVLNRRAGMGLETTGPAVVFDLATDAGLREDNRRLQGLVTVAIATRDDALEELRGLRSFYAAATKGGG